MGRVVAITAAPAQAPDLRAAAIAALDWYKQGGPCDWTLVQAWGDKLQAALEAERLQDEADAESDLRQKMAELTEPRTAEEE